MKQEELEAIKARAGWADRRADVLTLVAEVARLTAANKLLPKLMDALDQYGELRVSQFLVVNSELMAECAAWANKP